MSASDPGVVVALDDFAAVNLLTLGVTPEDTAAGIGRSDRADRLETVLAQRAEALDADLVNAEMWLGNHPLAADRVLAGPPGHPAGGRRSAPAGRCRSASVSSCPRPPASGVSPVSQARRR